MLIQSASSLLERTYLGKGLRSPLVTDPTTNDFARSEGNANVRDCIQDLLTTQVGERVMNEDFGTQISQLLFQEQVVVMDVLPVRVVEAINLHERRVTNVRCTVAASGENIVEATVSWTNRTDGSRDTLVYPFYLQSNNGGVAPNV